MTSKRAILALLIVGAAALLLYMLRMKSKDHAAPAPDVLAERFRSATPYERDSVASSMIGLHARWHLHLNAMSSVAPADGETGGIRETAPYAISAYWQSDAGHPATTIPVTLYLDLDRFPRFKRASEGQPFWVNAKIGHVADGPSFVLHDVEDIEFD
jgi:hypothetical protein